MSNTIIILGRGPSAEMFDLEHNQHPVLAVSGGITMDPQAEHFISLDKPRFFPDWLLNNPAIRKHIPYNVLNEKNTIWKRWAKYPNTVQFEYRVGNGLPNFSDHGPIDVGPLPRNYTLLAAVQLVPRLGFDRLIFAGTDLNDNELMPIAEVIKEWHPIAVDEGMRWEIAAPGSALEDTLPHYMPERIFA